MTKRVYLLIVGLCVFVGCGSDVVAPVGVDAEILADLNAEIKQGDYGEIHSLLVWQDGEMVAEYYYRGWDADELHYIYSVTKSFASTGIGIAVDEDLIDIEQPLFDFFADFEQALGTDGREAIVLEDVLTMTSGLEWDELSTRYGSPENDASQLVNSGNWIHYVLSREMVAEPGEQFAYSSGSSVLLSGVLEDTTENSAETYIAANLFTPLEITDYRWDGGSRQLTNTGWGLYLTPRDMLKLGQLYLQDGMWEGEQVVSADWVTASTKTQTDAGEDFEYGYQWWRYDDDHPVVAELAVNDLFFAWGFGGQFIFVVPHLDLIVVTTADNFDDSAQAFPMLPDYIFPALLFTE